MIFNPSLEEGGTENVELILFPLREREPRRGDNLRGYNLRGYDLVGALLALEARLEHEEMPALR